MYLKSTYVWICAIFVMVSCSQEEALSPEIDNSTSSFVLVRNQQPLAQFDETKYGLYHGTVLSATTMSRGKIWVNVANNGDYSAMIELVSGETLNFELDPADETITDEIDIFHFIGEAGSFSIDISDFEAPKLNSVELNNETFFAQIAKNRSNSLIDTETATFIETGNPAFSGTWSIMADGVWQNPNGDQGLAISSIMIVYDGVVYEDFTFELINSQSCLGSTGYVPVLNAFGTPGSVVADYQNTEFAGGMTKWDLSYDDDTSSYMDYITCGSENAGYFMWTSYDGTIERVGEIQLD